MPHTKAIGGVTAGPHGPRPPLLFLGGLPPPLFCLDILSLSNTISSGSSDKVNGSTKQTLQNFGSILSISFLTYYLQFGRICICLAECTMHSLSPCYGFVTALVLLNSVVRWCNTTHFFTKMVSLYMLVCMGVGRVCAGGH